MEQEWGPQNHRLLSPTPTGWAPLDARWLLAEAHSGDLRHSSADRIPASVQDVLSSAAAQPGTDMGGVWTGSPSGAHAHSPLPG